MIKIKNIFFPFILVFLLSSCALTQYYQLYNVKPIQKKITKSDNLFYEDDNCIITYNLWANGGDIGFIIYNKTNKNIYVNLNKSYFVLNGIAYDYFKNRTITKIDGISIKEKLIISIPSKTRKRISEYSINNSLIRNCDLFLYPSKKTIKTKSYSNEESPIIFSNIISYETKGEKITVENEFYVSEITNYPASKFFEYKYDEFCGQKSVSKTKNYKYNDVDKFYLKYIEEQNNLWNSEH